MLTLLSLHDPWNTIFEWIQVLSSYIVVCRLILYFLLGDSSLEYFTTLWYWVKRTTVSKFVNPKPLVISSASQKGPIRKLPNEILLTILMTLRPEARPWNRDVIQIKDKDEYFPWLHAIHVCRLWRSLMLNHKHFWVDIDCSHRIELIHFMLARSKDAPLSVTYRPTYKHNPAYNLVVIQQLHRIRNIKLYLGLGNIVHDFAAVLHGSQRPLVLSNISFQDDWSVPMMSRSVFGPILDDFLFSALPTSLTSLEYEGSVRHIVHRDLPSLTDLRLELSSASSKDVFAMLTCFPRLRTLHLRYYPRNIAIPWRSLELPQLEDFSYTGSIEMWRALQSSIVFPSSTRRTIILAYDSSPQPSVVRSYTEDKCAQARMLGLTMSFSPHVFIRNTERRPDYNGWMGNFSLYINPRVRDRPYLDQVAFHAKYTYQHQSLSTATSIVDQSCAELEGEEVDQFVLSLENAFLSRCTSWFTALRNLPNLQTLHIDGKNALRSVINYMHACANGEEPYDTAFPSLLIITIDHVDDPSASLRVMTYALEKRANARTIPAQHHISILLMLQEKLVKAHTWSEAEGLMEK